MDTVSALPNPTVTPVPGADLAQPAVTVPAETPDPPTPVPAASATPSPAAPATSYSASSPIAPIALACWGQGGSLEDHSLSTNLLPLPLEVRVYLPPCYHQEPDRRYPALYLIHGQYYTHNQWDRLGADELASKLIASGELSPFLMVMPRDRKWGQPYRDPFGQAVVDVLIPWIDATYRTLPDRENRAIGGFSRGASWAVHLGLSRWELFGALGAHSVPVFWSDWSRLPAWLDAIPSGSWPRIFLDTGDRDNQVRFPLSFESLLDEKAIPHEWYMFPGYHEEAYWQAHLEQYIRWYAAEW